MKLSNSGTVPVYTVSGSSTSRSLPEWLARQNKRSLKRDAEYQGRVEVLQDFSFDEASVCVRASEDGDWVMSTGTYKPQIHVHDLGQMSLSYLRHTDSLNHSFALLSLDASKSVHLQTDRRIEVQSQGGLHHAVRIPRYGRAIVYDRHSAEALVPAVGLDADGKGEVFRLNLEYGRFMRSYQIDLPSSAAVDGVAEESSGWGMQGSVDVGSVNAAAIAENTHNLLAFGSSVGTEFWDPRSRTRVGSLASTDGGAITALDFSPSGMSIVTGSSTGTMNIFDLRRPVPLLQRDQGYGFPIKKIMHVTTISHEHKVLSADKRIVKIWDEATGDPWTSVEPDVDINDVEWCKGTGMILSANEGSQQHAWFVPSLGPAPRWCSFLDNLVEDMAEESRNETYDNYKFLTSADLKSLSLDHLVGKTNLLRPYMHGYFVASKLYEQARLIVNPYVWEEERMKRVKAKVETERASRIRGSAKTKVKVKVNQKLVDKLLKRQENRETVDTSAGILGDARFKSLFEDDEFAIDEYSREFRALNPSTVVAPPSNMTNVAGAKAKGSESGTDDDDDDDEKISAPPRNNTKTGVSMRVSSSSQNHGRSHRDTVLGARIQKSDKAKTQRGQVSGEREITFLPERKNKKNAKNDEQPAPAPKKRFDARRSASANTLRRM